jgi:hypothetical protein
MEKMFAIADRDGNYYKETETGWTKTFDVCERYTRYECMQIILSAEYSECWHICDNKKFLPYECYFLDLLKEYNKEKEQRDAILKEKLKHKKREEPVQLMFKF